MKQNENGKVKQQKPKNKNGKPKNRNGKMKVDEYMTGYDHNRGCWHDGRTRVQNLVARRKEDLRQWWGWW